jgi:hypothetical protein
MFEDTLQPQGSDLSQVFKPLKGTLNVTKIFYASYWDGENSLINAFNTNEISATDSAFAICPYSSTASTERSRGQNIFFSSMFNPKYSNATYITKTQFHNTFCGYRSTVTFGTKTLNDDPSTHNYYQDG